MKPRLKFESGRKSCTSQSSQPLSIGFIYLALLVCWLSCSFEQFYELVDCRINWRRYLMPKKENMCLRRGWNSSVSTVTDYEQKDWTLILRQGSGFSLRHCLQSVSGIRQACRWVLGTLSTGVKRPNRESNHSHPSRAGVMDLCFTLS